MSYRGEMGEYRELDDVLFVLKEYRERMAPVWERLEENRKILDGLEREVRELEDLLRRDQLRFIKELADAIRGVTFKR